MSTEERNKQAAIKSAIAEATCRHKQKVLQDMAKYRKNRARLAKKAREARAAGLTYGYYVALVLEKRGRLVL